MSSASRDWLALLGNEPQVLRVQAAGPSPYRRGVYLLAPTPDTREHGAAGSGDRGRVRAGRRHSRAVRRAVRPAAQSGAVRRKRVIRRRPVGDPADGAGPDREHRGRALRVVLGARGDGRGHAALPRPRPGTAPGGLAVPGDGRPARPQRSLSGVPGTAELRRRGSRGVEVGREHLGCRRHLPGAGPDAVHVGGPLVPGGPSAR
jgi:hypothetical protein